MSTNVKIEKTIDVLPTPDNANKTKQIISELKEIANEESEIPKNIQEMKFWVHLAQESPMSTKLMKEKKIGFSFNPSEKEKKEWIKNGFPKLGHILTTLKKMYKKLANFELILFRDNIDVPFYFQRIDKLTNVYVNIDTYLKYGTAINDVIYKLKIVKYSNSIKKEYSAKVPIAFFNKRPTSELPAMLKTSHYAVIEEIINDVENMPEGKEKTDLTTIIVQSNLARKSFEEFNKLSSESPAKKLQSFTPALDKLSSKEVEILLQKILDSGISTKFINSVAKLPKKYQNKIAKKLPEMVTMHGKHEKLKDSLKKFKVLINKHNNSSTKDEAEIHKFLSTHYWLLGIEYFDKELLSDYDRNENKTNATKLEGSHKHPDFIIKRLDGFDRCVVIELEEANDPIFNKNGEFSKKVYDWIFQAADYNIEQKFRNMHSKGIAIIGSINENKLIEDQKKRFKLLLQEFPNIEILTYEQIIEKAQSTLDFWKEYKVMDSFKD